MNSKLIFILILFLAEIFFAQESTIQLPTSDNSSSFSITNQNSSSVFKVDGSGRMTGDGSGLSNLRPVVAYAGGEQTVIFHEGEVPGLNLYEAQIVREVTISCPGSGLIFAVASGYAQWEGPSKDLLRIWFHPYNSWPYTWDSPDAHNLRLISDYGCTNPTEQFTSWSITKTYVISSAQDFTVKLCADKPFDYSKASIGDSQLQLIYFPLGGTGASASVYSLDENVSETSFDNNSIDGTARLSNDNGNNNEVGNNEGNNKLKELEDEIKILKEKIDLILEKKDKD